MLYSSDDGRKDDLLFLARRRVHSLLSLQHTQLESLRSCLFQTQGALPFLGLATDSIPLRAQVGDGLTRSGRFVVQRACHVM